MTFHSLSFLLAQTLSNQFVEDPATGVLLLGLHGMPGLGKTTISKALCDHFHSELVGRVCRVELSDSSTTPLTRQKQVLKQLWGIKSGVLDIISDVDQVMHSDANDFSNVIYIVFRVSSVRDSRTTTPTAASNM